ncbi:Sfum_1244 family protein [Pseudomonadota bacterium]
MDETDQELLTTVRKNCEISDARHAGDYSLCIYLLKMRELYRWEKKLAMGEPIEQKEIGVWMGQREQLWETLEDVEYLDLKLVGNAYNPFDQDAINQLLLPKGLVYGSGYGRFSKPYFFLARLLRQENPETYRILITGTEYAREISAPPAISAGNTLFIRRESLRRMVWEMVEEWRWQKRQNAMSRVLDCYEQDLNTAVERITDNEIETLILHEIGERIAGELIGEDWKKILATTSCTITEIMVRAVRDNLADCLSLLPGLLSEKNEPSLHFYFANLNSLRKDLFPALYQGYQSWLNGEGYNQLTKVVCAGKNHWLSVARKIIEQYVRYGDECLPKINALVTDRTTSL